MVEEVKAPTNCVERLNYITQSLHSLSLPVMFMEKNYDQINKTLDSIVKQLEKLNTNFQGITPKNILVGIFSDWRVILTVVCIASACGVDILSVLPELKKIL